MRRDRRFHIYILASSSGTLYIGVTNNLVKRVWQHKQGEIAGFTKTYAVDRLVCFESFVDIRTAINREKQLKGWMRAKKISLIERENPGWLGSEPGVVSAEWSFDSAAARLLSG